MTVPPYSLNICSIYVQVGLIAWLPFVDFLGKLGSIINAH